MRKKTNSTAPLYQRLLGDAWDVLPPAIRAMHCVDAGLTAKGHATVTRGTGLLARLLAKCIGFPQAGAHVPVEVSFTVVDGEETWQRNFGGKRFISYQREGRGRWERLLSERFGILDFGIALVLEQERLRLIVRHWTLLGIPMPRFLAPTGETYEEEIDGIFHFHVTIQHPLTGPIVHYKGQLVPVGA